MNETISEFRPLCRACRSRPVTTKGRSPNGKMRYRTKCWKCERPDRIRNPIDRQKFRQRFFIPCEHCGKVPENISDFEIDHKDANRHNNSLDNLQSLCTSCHILKSQTSGDYLPKHMKIFDETYRGAYTVPQGARMYKFTPFDLIMSVVSDYEPTATHCEAVWERSDEGITIGMRAVVWTQVDSSVEEVLVDKVDEEEKDA